MKKKKVIEEKMKKKTQEGKKNQKSWVFLARLWSDICLILV